MRHKIIAGSQPAKLPDIKFDSVIKQVHKIDQLRCRPARTILVQVNPALQPIARSEKHGIEYCGLCGYGDTPGVTVSLAPNLARSKTQVFALVHLSGGRPIGVALTDNVEWNATEIKIDTKELGLKQSVRLIACQPPFGAHWRPTFSNLLLEQKAGLVVSLAAAATTTDGKGGYTAFLPRTAKPIAEHGYSATLKSQTNFDHGISIVREHSIETPNGQSGSPTQLIFNGWENGKFPSNFKAFVRFLKLIYDHMKKLNPDQSVVVHCNAGVGRTGTNIACLILLELFLKNGSVSESDVVKVKNLIRKQRPAFEHEDQMAGIVKFANFLNANPIETAAYFKQPAKDQGEVVGIHADVAQRLLTALLLLFVAWLLTSWETAKSGGGRRI